MKTPCLSQEVEKYFKHQLVSRHDGYVCGHLNVVIAAGYNIRRENDSNEFEIAGKN